MLRGSIVFILDLILICTACAAPIPSRPSSPANSATMPTTALPLLTTALPTGLPVRAPTTSLPETTLPATVPPLALEHLEWIASVPALSALNGVVVLTSRVTQTGAAALAFSRIHLWNLATNSQKTIEPPGRSVDNVILSPNRQWLAYEEGPGQTD